MALFHIIFLPVTFSIPCILIQLLQFEPTNAHNFIEVTVILQHTSSYVFRASLAHLQGAHNCTKQLLNFPIFVLFCNCVRSLVRIVTIPSCVGSKSENPRKPCWGSDYPSQDFNLEPLITKQKWHSVATFGKLLCVRHCLQYLFLPQSNCLSAAPSCYLQYSTFIQKTLYSGKRWSIRPWRFILAVTVPSTARRVRIWRV